MNMFIYVLIDPRDGGIRYVGQTKRTLDWRLRQHVAAGRGVGLGERPVARWIREVLDHGLLPSIAIVEQTTVAEADAAELRWIQRLEADGHPLTNMTGTEFGKKTYAERYRRISVEGAAYLSATIPPLPPLPPPDPPPNTSSEEIRSFRSRMGWTQAQLARAIGYHDSGVSLWESGKRPAPASIRLAMERLESKSKDEA